MICIFFHPQLIRCSYMLLVSLRDLVSKLLAIWLIVLIVSGPEFNIVKPPRKSDELRYLSFCVVSWITLALSPFLNRIFLSNWLIISFSFLSFPKLYPYYEVFFKSRSLNFALPAAELVFIFPLVASFWRT